MKAELEMKKVTQWMAYKGISPTGDIQRFNTNNVLRRIAKYMPYLSGSLIKLTVAQTDINKPEIVTQGPQARCLYHGKLMRGRKSGSAYAKRGEIKKVTNKNLNYTKTKNPQAGPYWDRALSANEMPALEHDLQDYINRKG